VQVPSQGDQVLQRPAEAVHLRDHQLVAGQAGNSSALSSSGRRASFPDALFDRGR
jgi:hypothetical protein